MHPVGECRPVKPFRRQAASHAEPFDAGRVVALIEAHRHDHLRHAGRQRLRHRADAAVVHEHRRPREQPAEGHEVHVPHRFRQCRRNLLGKPREQESAVAESLAGLGGGPEEVAAKHVGRSGREHERRRARLDESHHVGRRFDHALLTVERKPGEPRLGRPVRLPRGEPFRKHRDQPER